MLCLEMMISFENIDLTQILCLANKKNLNLDLSQIHHYYKKWLKISNWEWPFKLYHLKFFINDFLIEIYNLKLNACSQIQSLKKFNNTIKKICHKMMLTL